MNDEINIKIPGQILDYVDTKEHLLDLFNYITNLQQLYENALKINQNENKYRTELETKYIVLQQENERLKENNGNMQEEMARVWEENERLKEELFKSVNNTNKSIELTEDYKYRCEKAIEYINKNKHLSMFADCREPKEDWNYDLECSANDLLNILQNGSDDKN